MAQPNQEEFNKLAKPLIDFINKYYHPHTTIIITPTNAEVLEGSMMTPHNLLEENSDK